AVARQAQLFGTDRRIDRRADQRLARDPARVPRFGATGVLVHQRGHQALVQRTPVGADAYRLAVRDGLLDDRGELAFLLLAEADVARVDAVLGQRLGTGRLGFEQLVAVVVEIANDRHL